MKFNILLILAITLIAPVYAGAQLYKYYDENNQLSFTDDYSKIPIDQRKKTKTIPEVKPKQETVNKTQNGKTAEDASASASAERTAALKKEFSELSELKNKLDEQYNELKKTEKALSVPLEDPVPLETLNAHNKKVEGFNKKLAQYRKEHNAYLERVKNYNEKIK